MTVTTLILAFAAGVIVGAVLTVLATGLVVFWAGGADEMKREARRRNRFHRLDDREVKFEPRDHDDGGSR